MLTTIEIVKGLVFQLTFLEYNRSECSPHLLMGGTLTQCGPPSHPMDILYRHQDGD